jgi:hypothetical protein
MLIRVLTAIVAIAAFAGSAVAQQAQSCGRETFSKAVDDAAAVLRRHSSETQPRIQAGIRQLKARHGWRDEEEADRAREMLADPETEALDHKAAQLLAAMDRLSEEGAQRPGDCSKLAELRATASALSVTVRQKSDLILRRIEAALALPSGERLSKGPDTAATRTPSLSATPRLPSAVQPIDVSRPAFEARAPETASAMAAAPWTAPWAAPLVPPAPAEAPLGQWSVTTTPQPTDPPAAVIPPLPQPRRVAAIAPSVAPVPPSMKSGAAKPVGETYSIDEINSAARGGLPNWSASVASVIEHAFSKYGRPTAYVIGEEGGGAFIAGVRYGNGKLYMKGKSVAKVYWHGPSVGYDFGAAGSQTLFLIYGMREARDIYRGFSGIDGAAYFIGGAGITFLNNEEIIMAPIRTGYGFRLGASVGYIRFASKPTWNPF